jgi:tetratricopeptide (TPR) repeat protein
MVLRREGFGEEHPLVANSLHNLGLVDKDTGNVDEALRKITRAVEILETALPPNHPWLGAAVRDLAMVQLSMGDVDEAIRGMERAVEILPEDPIVWYNVACLKARTGDPEAALDGLERAVELGFADLEQIESDPDLESLRQDERFVGIVSGASENRAAG